MNVNYTKTLARKTLIAFLLLILILCIAAFFVRNSIIDKLASISALANNIEKQQVQPQQSLLLLQQAEDDFQQSLIDPDSGTKDRYKVRITTAFNKIDTLLRSVTDTSSLSKEQASVFRELYKRKIHLSDRLLVLRHDFDSLLTIYSQFNEEKIKSVPVIKNVGQKRVNKSTTVTVDTIKKAEPENKKLFARIKAAFSNKKTVDTNIIVINKNESLHSVLPQQAYLGDRHTYSKELQQLHQRNVKLQKLQQKLITLNFNINSELTNIIRDFREINYKMSDELKRVSFRNYQQTTAILNHFHLIALCLVTLFAILLIWFIIQLNKAEVFLRKENERSIIMARQKMDLLLHMSHEIRNPLTAIRGFLSVFSRTSLTVRQKEMLESIRSSSDMLLLTLNDTLDAAKMENSEFRINNAPFNPNFVLKEVIESMRYSAIKKKLDLFYEFSGDDQAMVLGDSFRLKQVLVNLCSNAIKYTAEGSIFVKVALLDEDKGMTIDVIDTGVGISEDQQVSLFSKYYQTTSSRGQVGTGLGLYICKQLIERKGGTITVKSAAGAGSTFSVFIPYKRQFVPVLKDADDLHQTMASLQGKRILAVDDMELNLLFLKMITSKWNVSFHQSESAEGALELLQSHAFDLILTDIQLPNMSGVELLEKIRAMDNEQHRAPVIALSGLSSGTDGATLLAKGFSGFVRKPFVESDLLEQVIKALKENPQ